ncbi:MAG: glycosyltransferase family 2 protein [Pseudohongiellaceae bacterium]
MKTTVTILVPVKDEEASLPILFAKFEQVLEGLVADYEFHVLVLDDGSKDGSAAVVKAASAQSYSIGLCSFTRNFGKESAIAAGLDRCDSDLCLLMDADLQHPPELISDMLKAWQQGHKLVECVKSNRGEESAAYRMCSQLFYRFFSNMSAIELTHASDFKLLDKEIVHAIRSLPEKSRFFRGLVTWMGYTAYEIPFDVPKRQQGETSWGALGLLKYSMISLTSFSSAPLQLVTVIGVLMLLLSLIIGSTTLYQWALGNAVTGFTTVIILLLMIGSMLMISLGLIGLYISKIYEEVKSRPGYVVKEDFGPRPDKHD